jgi:hypothetical protein
VLSVRAVSTGLVLALVGAEGVLLVQRGLPTAGPGVVIAPGDTRVARRVFEARASVAETSIEPAFLAHMTADDVARGVYALAAVEGTVALTDPQRATIGPLLREGADLRARLGELRGQRRAAREAWMVDGAGIAGALGPDRSALWTAEEASTTPAPPRAGPR